jgi:transposase
MKAYSLDLRRRVVAAFEAGAPWPEIVRPFGVSRATLNRYRKRLRDAGSLAPGRSPGRPRGIAPPDEPALEARLRAAPEAALADHCRWRQEERGEAVSISTMRRAIRRLGWTRKKQ